MKIAAIDTELARAARIVKHTTGFDDFAAFLSDNDSEVMYLLQDAIVIKCPKDKVAETAKKLEEVFKP